MTVIVQQQQPPIKGIVVKGEFGRDTDIAVDVFNAYPYFQAIPDGGQHVRIGMTKKRGRGENTEVVILTADDAIEFGNALVRLGDQVKANG